MGEPDSPSTLDTATEAMHRWRAGAASGDWSRLLAMMDPDVAFHVPVDGFAGVQRGADAAARFFDHLTGAVRADLEVTSVLCGGERTAFEVSVRGRWLGRPFTQRLCLVFVAAEGRVREFAEYLAWPGGLPPQDPRDHEP